uniref:DUF4587 domain-containing protein n=1 Tax=Erpetoichthys calabaricus TaxID=27687 RepID=A0A8C4XC53_ERPCA
MLLLLLDALHSALRRKRDLLQKLREQHMLDELSRPHTWGGTRKKYHQQDLPPVQFYQIPAPPPPPPPPPPEPPRIIQHTVSCCVELSRFIRQPLDMVEMMLMQNAQMHQIIMQNMMLKALPPMAFTPPGSCGNPAPSSPQPRPVNRPRASSVHHHHHYTPPALQGPPLPNQLPPIGYPMWPPGMSSNPLGQAGGFPPSLPHMNGPVTLPALYT